jgi:hypothetical protein
VGFTAVVRYGPDSSAFVEHRTESTPVEKGLCSEARKIEVLAVNCQPWSMSSAFERAASISGPPDRARAERQAKAVEGAGIRRYFAFHESQQYGDRSLMHDRAAPAVQP